MPLRRPIGLLILHRIHLFVPRCPLFSPLTLSIQSRPLRQASSVPGRKPRQNVIKKHVRRPWRGDRCTFAAGLERVLDAFARAVKVCRSRNHESHWAQSFYRPFGRQTEGTGATRSSKMGLLARWRLRLKCRPGAPAIHPTRFPRGARPAGAGHF